MRRLSAWRKPPSQTGHQLVLSSYRDTMNFGELSGALWQVFIDKPQRRVTLWQYHIRAAAEGFLPSSLPPLVTSTNGHFGRERSMNTRIAQPRNKGLARR